MSSTDLGFQKVQSTIILKDSGPLKGASNSAHTLSVAAVGEVTYAFDSVFTPEARPLEKRNPEGDDITSRLYAISNDGNEKVAEPIVWATEVQSLLMRFDDVTGDILIGPQAKGGGERVKNTENLAQRQIERDPDENPCDMESGINHI